MLKIQECLGLIEVSKHILSREIKKYLDIVNYRFELGCY